MLTVLESYLSDEYSKHRSAGHLIINCRDRVQAAYVQGVIDTLNRVEDDEQQFSTFLEYAYIPVTNVMHVAEHFRS